MSRFWGGDDSESASESGSENEEAVAPTPQSAKPKASNRFLLADFDDDDDQPQQKRVVKSQKDRRYEDILASIAIIKAATKSNEWNTIATEFDKLNRHVQKAATVIEKEGVPRFYTKALANLEDALKGALDSKIKLNPTNTKSLNAMKLKLKKHNKTYEKEIQEYRKNPDAGSDNEQDEEGKEEEKEPEEPKEVPKPAPKKEEKKEEKKPAPKELDGESESESEEESSEGERDAQPEVSQLKGKDKWLKKTAVDTKSDQAKKKQKKDKKKPSTRPDGSTPTQKEKSGSKDTELDKEAIDKKLEEIISLRGKKGTDRNEQIQQLVVLSEKAKTPEQAVAVLMNLVSGMFDINPNINLHMSAENWKKTHTYMTKILVLLKENNVPLIEPDDEGEIQMAALETTEKKIIGSLIAFTERLGDELLKSLQFTDPHTEEYVKRLQDENLFLDVAKAALDHYAAHRKMHKAARVAVRLIEHLYYKTETKPEQATQLAKSLQELSALVYQHADDKHFAKIKTVLCNIYHLALYDKYFEARDLLLMSHLQDNIQHMDVSTQILSNRTMVQLGLCAFRKGLIQEAHSALSEICSSGKVKELLAQGITGRFSDKNPEQEKLEKRRQVPYHMQINLELLECVHLISAMLLEVPNMAANPYDSKRKVISRQFRRLLDYNERQVFNGPPENTRETVLAASRGLSKGDWKTCEALLLKLNIWNLVSNSETIKAMLRRKIQEEGLRTFLFTYSRHYSSLSLTHLTEMFELPVNVVHSLVSKMMINDELHASWDQPTSSILMHKVEPTRLQHLALQISEKAAFFVENNEKILDPRFGFKPYEGKGPQGGKGGGAGGQGADRWQPPKSGGRYQGKGRNPAYSNN